MEPNLDETRVFDHLRKMNNVIGISTGKKPHAQKVDNFEVTVHQLNPRSYEEDELKLSFVRIRRCKIGRAHV